MKVILLTLLIAINLYSPFSVATSILFNVLFAFSVVFNRRKFIAFTVLQKRAIGISFLLLCWAFIVSIANSTFDNYVLGKFFRTLLNTFLLAMIFRGFDYKLPQFLKALVIALLLNSIAVYIQILFPSSKELFLSIANFTKKTSDLRVFGLFSSYDSTGLTTCFLMVVLWLGFVFRKNNLFLVIYFLIFSSSLYISRMTMIISVLVFVGNVYFFYSKKGNNMVKYLVIFPIIIITGFLTYNKVYDVIDRSINKSGNDEINNSYSNRSTDILINDMTVLPEDFVSTVIGTAKSIESSDIGYVKIIFMVGVIGLVLILYYHYSLLKLFVKTVKSDIIFRVEDKRYLIILLKGLVFLFLLFNSKLLLIYSRGFNDFFLILLFGIERIMVKNKIINFKT